MFRFLLGVLVGAAIASTWKSAPSRMGMRPHGRVDELSSAAGNVIADPAVNAGDGTSSQAAATGI